MDWMQHFELFLFDFDGLLVDTEHLHYQAYKKMLQLHKMELTWSFERYCLYAHYSSETFRTNLLEEYPLLKSFPWETLYHEKQQIIQELLRAHPPDLMEGAEKLLDTLQKHAITHCVVTHSADSLVALVKQKYQVLERIPYWITRHDYTHPKCS